MHRQRGVTRWGARLLLLLALLLGLSAMHTLGHPAGGHSPTAAPAGHSTAGHVGPVGQTEHSAQSGPAAGAAHETPRPPGEDGGAPDLDPLTACLAVLALGATGLLLADRRRVRRRTRTADLAARWQPPALPPPLPPPPHAVRLARLSLLRV